MDSDRLPEQMLESSTLQGAGWHERGLISSRGNDGSPESLQGGGNGGFRRSSADSQVADGRRVSGMRPRASLFNRNRSSATNHNHRSSHFAPASGQGGDHSFEHRNSGSSNKKNLALASRGKMSRKLISSASEPNLTRRRTARPSTVSLGSPLRMASMASRPTMSRQALRNQMGSQFLKQGHQARQARQVSFIDEAASKANHPSLSEDDNLSSRLYLLGPHFSL